MSEVLDRIERQLVAAAAAPPRRRRLRRRWVGVAAGTALFALGAGTVTALTIDTPIDRLFGSAEVGARQPGTGRIDLTVTDALDGRWLVTTYLRQNGALATTSALNDENGDFPPVNWASPFAIAVGFAEEGPARGTIRFAGEDRRHVLYYGIVDAGAEKVSVAVGQARGDALLSDDTLTVAVKADPSRLTAQGRELAARLPDSLTVRTFAVSLPWDQLPRGAVVRPQVTVTLHDGEVHRQETAAFKLP
jgi:hypothetical protein